MLSSPSSIWLARICERLDDLDHAVLFEGSEAEPRAAWPEPDLDPEALCGAAAAAFAARQVVLHPGAKDEQGAPAWEKTLAIPIGLAGRHQAVVALAFRGLSSDRAEQVCSQVDQAGYWLPVLLSDGAAPAAPREADSFVLGLVATLVEHPDPRRAWMALVSELATLLACERTSLGLLHGDEMRLEAVSHSASFDPRSRLARALVRAMEEAVDAECAIRWSGGGEATQAPQLAHAQLCEEQSIAYVVSVPLSAHGEALGALTVEYRHKHPAVSVVAARLEQAAAVLGPILALRRAEALPVGRRILAALRHTYDSWVGAQQRGAQLAAGTFAALLIVLALWPATYRVGGPARLEGTIQRAIVAPIEGYVAEARARAGDTVRRGDVLGSIDDTELRLERRKWVARSAQLEKEYRSALASGDPAEIRIVRSRRDQAKAELALAEEKLARTRLVAPFDGIVAQGDLSRSLGSPVERGEVMFEIATLDRYRIVLEIPDHDIADVAVGQAGLLTLSAHPDEALPLVVERIVPVAVSEDERNYFRVEAQLERPMPSLRPGMEGIGKVDVGTRSVLWIHTHTLVDWLRIRLWSHLP
jgi:RND family efflux transporter MFP subunit